MVQVSYILLLYIIYISILTFKINPDDDQVTITLALYCKFHKKSLTSLGVKYDKLGDLQCSKIKATWLHYGKCRIQFVFSLLLSHTYILPNCLLWVFSNENVIEWIFTRVIELIRHSHKFAVSADEDCLRWTCGHMRWTSRLLADYLVAR